MSHDLTVKNLIDQISIYELLKWNEIEPFFKRLITGDEKWITYDNIKKNYGRSKVKLHKRWQSQN